PAGYSQMPTGYPAAAPTGYPGAGPATGGYPAQNPPELTQTSPVMPGTMYGKPGMGGSPYGYPQMGGPGQQVMGGHGYESSDMIAPAAYGQMPFVQSRSPQGLPVGTGAMVDCGCGSETSLDVMQPAAAAPNAVPTNFVPPTPPIYSAPYTGPVNIAQPPYMNPYGIGPVGTNPYGMPGYSDESI
ncbi:hypothetical protein V7150_11835, partial [Neobacillus drentensis]